MSLCKKVVRLFLAVLIGWGAPWTLLAQSPAPVSAPVSAPPARSAKGAEFWAASYLFFNVKEQILNDCVYRPTGRDITAGVLNGMARDLGPGFARHFPQNISAQGDLFAIFKQTLLNVMQDPACSFTPQTLVERGVQAYCRTLDRYSKYETFDSWQQAKQLDNPDFIGVGMTIIETGDSFFCIPFPGGPAERAGVISGDQLVEVDNVKLKNVSRQATVNLIRGKEHTTVNLKVRHRDGVEQTLRTDREAIKSSPLRVEEGEAGPVITIRNIDGRTVQDLKVLFKSVGPNKEITLDLRGCPGGEVTAAVDLCSLFLPEDTMVGKLETVKGKETLLSTNPAPYRPAKLIILQDGGTASAAELVIVALSSFPKLKVETRGEKSFGKGITQNISQISDLDGENKPIVKAGFLTISDSRMYGPHDEVWDGEGLDPSIESSQKR